MLRFKLAVFACLAFLHYRKNVFLHDERRLGTVSHRIRTYADTNAFLCGYTTRGRMPIVFWFSARLTYMWKAGRHTRLDPYHLSRADRVAHAEQALRDHMTWCEFA